MVFSFFLNPHYISHSGCLSGRGIVKAWGWAAARRDTQPSILTPGRPPCQDDNTRNGCMGTSQRLRRMNTKRRGVGRVKHEVQPLGTEGLPTLTWHTRPHECTFCNVRDVHRPPWQRPNLTQYTPNRPALTDSLHF